MNKELIEHLRIEAGISRTVDSTGKVVTGLICINREGNVIDPLEGLQIFAKLIIEEAIHQVEDVFWSDPHEVYEAMELIKKHFGIDESPTLVDTISKETWNHDASQDNVNATDYKDE